MPIPPYLPAPSLTLGAPLPTDGLAALVGSEMAFAQMASERGVKAAFLNYLAEDSILFRPLPVSGQKWQQSRPEPGIRLTWRPSVAELSASGDLGWTTGPWELRKSKEDGSPLAQGHFVTLWKKQTDGQWKVLLDDGIDHPQPAEAAPALAAHVLTASRALTAPKVMEGLDAALAGGAAQGKLIAADIRVYRPEQIPTQGRSAFAQALSGQGRVSTWAPLGSGLSLAGDLGYTYGVAALQQNVKASYLHIWRRNGTEWELALEILRPLPPNA